MKSDGLDDLGLNYEKYYGSGPILSFRFFLGILIEFVGSFIINFIGLLACLLHAKDAYDVSVLGVGCAFGGAYLFVSKIFRKVGSCHFNPAFSLCSLFHGNVAVLYCFLSFLVQIAAVFTASCLLSLVMGAGYDIRYATVLKPQGISTATMLVSEFVGSLLQISCRLVTARDSAIDEYYTALSMVISIAVFIPYSGGSMNPARAVGTILYAMADKIPNYYWVYWCGPLGAAFLTILLLFTGVLHKKAQ